jgi:hypothetical protein
MTVAELWRRGQSGWPRKYPVVQLPNAPLLVALAGLGFAAATGGAAHDVGRAVFYLGLSVWALQEAISGVNPVRRLLGAGFLIWLAVSLATQL